ncbi:MAG: hypothetical protein OSB61_08075 [Verrucomicrobiota bacterium]|nr:hypothetical protein [Verrucomicrobiota bacterium]
MAIIFLWVTRYFAHKDEHFPQPHEINLPPWICQAGLFPAIVWKCFDAFGGACRDVVGFTAVEKARNPARSIKISRLGI